MRLALNAERHGRSPNVGLSRCVLSVSDSWTCWERARSCAVALCDADGPWDWRVLRPRDVT